MEINRKLASIRIVSDIKPIPDADKIELISIDGWKVVAQKGLYQIGSKVVYFEVDSFLPVIPQFEWLRKSSYRSDSFMGEGFRIRTVKLRGQISQGILMPISEINEILFFPVDDYEVGHDLTAALCVKKWDPPVIAENAKGNFPSFIPKTDQERWQNLTKEIAEWSKTENSKITIVTEKLDGSSITVYVKDGQFGVCSRNLEVKEESKFYQAALKYNLKEKMLTFSNNFALQGELLGPGVQGNRYDLKELEIFFFNAFDIENQVYLNEENFCVISWNLNLKIVPLITQTDFKNINFTDFSWKSQINPNVIPEGVVVSNFDRSFSFKSINPEFLLKE